MAEKDDFNLDDFNFDNFDDEFDFDGGFDTGDAGKGNALSRLAYESKSSLKEKAKSPSFYARILKAAAPSKFSALFEIGESVSRNSESLYNKAIEDASPAGKVLKRQLKRNLPVMRGLMSEKMYKSLDEALTHEEEYRPPSKEEQTNEAVANAMGEFTERQTGVERVRYTEERKRFSFSQRAEQMRHGEMLLVSKTIARNQKRQIAFNEQVLYKLHRKSLEVQFRSLYAIRDLTDLNREGHRQMLEQLKVIAERAALPDAVKLQSSEHFKQMLRESLISRVQSNFGGGIGNVIDGISASITKKVSGAIKDIGGMISQVGDMSEMMDEDMLYAAGADMAVDSAADMGGGFLGKILGKNKKAKRWMENKGSRIARNTAEFGNSAAEWMRMNPDALADKDKRWYKGNTDFKGVDAAGNPIEMGNLEAMGGWFARMLRDVASDGITYKDNLGIKDASAFMGKQALFTNKVATSITDVIPSLLAMQLQLQQKQMGIDADLLRYDYGGGKWSTEKENAKSVVASLRSSVSPGYARRVGDETVDEVDRKKELDPETRKHLRTQLLVNSYEHRTLDAKNFARADQFHESIPPEIRMKLIEFMQKNYSFKDNEPYNRFKDQRIARAKSSYSELSRFLPSILDEIQNQYLAGNGNLLLEIGAMKKDGKGMVFNPEYVLNLINSIEDGDSDADPEEEVKNSLTDAILAAAAKVSKKANSLADRAADLVGDKMEEHGIIDRASEFITKSSRRIDTIARWEARKLKRKFTRAELDGWKESVKSKFATAKTKSGAKATEVYEKMNKFVTDKEFRDELTGKAVTRLEELKGNIVDKDGNLLITKEDVMRKIDEMLDKPGASQSAMDYVSEKAELAQQAAMERLDELGVTDKVNNMKAEAEKKYEQAKSFNYKEAFETNRDKAKGYFSKLKETILSKIGKGEKVTEGELATAIALSEDPTAPISTGPTNSTARGGMGVGGEFNSSGVNDRLDRLIALTEENRGFLEAIAVKEISGIISEGGIDPKLIEKLLREKNPGFLKSLGRVGLKLGSAGALAVKGMAHVSWATAKIGGAAIKFGGGAALDTAKWAWGGTKRMLGFYSDIYVRGQKAPVLDVKGLQKGIYQDVNSGKRVKVYKDITGPVMNIETGKLALTQEEFDSGLYDYSGKPIIGNILRKVGSIYAGMLTPLVYGAKAVAGIARGVYGFVFNNPDVYSRGDMETPKLYAKLMEHDQYFSKKDGKPVRSFKDIKGEVVDLDGNICLTLGDIRAGLCDYRGKPLKTNLERYLLNPAKAAISAVLQVGITGVKAGWGIMKALGRGAANIFGGLKRGFLDGKNDEAKITAMAGIQTNDILLQILDMLDERLPGRKVRGDANSDGVRDGSIEDIRKNRTAASATEEAADEKAKEGGIFSKMKGLFTSLFGGKDKDGEGEEGEDGDTYIGGDFSGDGDKDEKKKKRRRGRGGARRTPPGGAGNLANSGWWNKTKGFFTRGFGGRALGTMGRFGKRAAVVAGMGAVGMLMGGTVGAVLAGAAAFLGAPIIAAALAVGTIGYLGYQAYKWYGSGSEWEQLLDSHYGLKNPTGEQKEALKLLHDDMESSFKADGEKGTAVIKKETVQKASELFGAQSHAQANRFVQWVVGRVRPVFIRLKSALGTFNPRLKLTSADSLPNQQLLAFLKRIEYNNNCAPLYEELPFPIDPANTAYIRDMQLLHREYMKKISEKVGKELGGMKGDAVSAAEFADLDGSDIKAGALGSKDKGGITGAGFTAAAMATSEAQKQLKGSVTGGAAAVTETLASIDKVRYFAYGLKELEPARVATLRALEEDMAKSVKFGRHGTPTVSGGDKDFLELYAPRFGIDLKDPKATIRFLDWFYKRFLPAFFAFVGEVRSVSGATSDFFARARKLSQENMGAIGTAIINAKNSGWFGKPIWAINASPWAGYELLNDSKGPYNICLDLMAGVGKDDSASKYAAKSESTKVPTGDKAKATGSSSGSSGTGSGVGTTGAGGAQTPKDVASHQSDVSRIASGNPTAASKPAGAPTLDMTPSSYGNYSGLKEKQRVTAKQPIGDYIMPTSGVVSSSFKLRKHPTLGVTRRHAGVDIAAPKGTDIYAINDGKVIAMGNRSGMGKFIFIQHKDGYQSRYLHLNAFHSTMKQGVDVTKGQLIGTVGMTGGQSSGDHLHLAIVKGSGTGTNVEFIDPAQFYDDQAKKGPSKGSEEADGGDVPVSGGSGLANTAPVAGASPASSPSAPKTSAGGSSATAAEDLIKSQINRAPATPSSDAPASGGADLNDMIENSAHMQDKLARIGDENKLMAENMKLAVGHLKSIDANIGELVGLMRGKGGGNTSQANKPPPRTAQANVVSFKK